MLPKEIIELFTKTMVGHVGTRDAKLQSTELMPWGVKLDAEKKNITVYIPKSIAGRTIANLESNKMVSLVIGEPTSHEYYQFKGTYISHADADADEEQLMDRFVHTFFSDYMTKFGYPLEIIQTVAYKPAIGFRFHIEEIYNQSPGPLAGKMIYQQSVAV